MGAQTFNAETSRLKDFDKEEFSASYLRCTILVPKGNWSDMGEQVSHKVFKWKTCISKFSIFNSIVPPLTPPYPDSGMIIGGLISAETKSQHKYVPI